MSEGTRRTLRNNRKPPNYLANQVTLLRLQQEESGMGGNMRSGQSKQFLYSPAQINVLAKLLVKFINQANQDLKNARKPPSHEQSDKDRKNDSHTNSKNLKSEKTHPEIHKKSTTNNRQIDDENSKKTGQLYSFKGQHSNPDFLRNSLGNEASKIKHNLNQEPPFNMSMGTQYIPLIQMNEFQNLYPQDLKFNTIPLGHFLVPPNAYSNMLMKTPMSGKLPHSNKNQKHQHSLNRIVEKNQLASDTKLFKRSSFHVAIAYHIHIKKLKASGRELHDNDIDPTYQAKKLKEQKHKDMGYDNKLNGK